MNLIRIGNTYINMDRVAQVSDLSTRDGGGQVVAGLIRVEFEGGGRLDLVRDAASMLSWLDQQSTHLPPPITP